MRNSFERAIGWAERGHNFYFRGCNFSAVVDFEEWATSTGCGTEPLDGPLIFHGKMVRSACILDSIRYRAEWGLWGGKVEMRAPNGYVTSLRCTQRLM